MVLLQVGFNDEASIATSWSKACCRISSRSIDAKKWIDAFFFHRWPPSLSESMNCLAYLYSALNVFSKSKSIFR